MLKSRGIPGISGQECDRSGSLKRDIHQGTNTPSARAKVPSAAASLALKENDQRTTAFHNRCQRLSKTWVNPSLPTSSLRFRKKKPKVFSTLLRNSSPANSSSAATHGALRVGIRVEAESLSSTRWIHPTARWDTAQDADQWSSRRKRT